MVDHRPRSLLDQSLNRHQALNRQRTSYEIGWFRGLVTGTVLGVATSLIAIAIGYAVTRILL